MDREDADFARLILDAFGADETIIGMRGKQDDEAKWESDRFVIYCGMNNLDSTMQMIHDMYVHAGATEEQAKLWVYGPPPPPPERPDPVRVAILFNGEPAQEALRKMGIALAESIAVIGTIGNSCGVAIKDFSEDLAAFKRQKDQLFLLDEATTMQKVDFRKQMEQISQLARNPDELQARRRGKKKRGHNHDHDRVIGGKGGYC